MMKKLFLMMMCALTVASVHAQKKPLDHSVYDVWRSVGAISVPRNGDILMYNINPGEGDTELVIENIRITKLSSENLSNTSLYVVCKSGE